MKEKIEIFLKCEIDYISRRKKRALLGGLNQSETRRLQDQFH